MERLIWTDELQILTFLSSGKLFKVECLHKLGDMKLFLEYFPS